MASGTLYTYAENFRAFKALIAAEYSGAKVSLADFKFGVTNKSPEFLKKFPLGKVPAFEGCDGFCLSESNAIAYYVASDALRGADVKSAAQVQMFVEFADNEVLPSACTWVFPTLGIKQFNKGETEQATAHIKVCLEYLNNVLATRTFLVGERVTLADISLCCNVLMLYKQVLEPKFRAPYGNVTRWFLTCVNQPQFKKVLGDVTLCEKMAQFDAKKFASLNPKPAKDNKKKDTKKQAQQPKKPAPEKKPEPEEESEPAPKSKPKDPLASLPPSKFVMDDWKRIVSNNETDYSMDWLDKNADREGYSLWYMIYKHNDEQKKLFMAHNLLAGFFQRLETMRKYAFGCANVSGVEEPKANICISGVWLIRGQKLPFDLCEDWNRDAPYYDFKRLEWDNADDLKTFQNYLECDGDYHGLPYYNVKLLR